MIHKSSSRVVAIVQARMGSTRAPGKVLRLAGGVPLLEHLVTRLRAARKLDDIVIATSDLPGDDPIASLSDHLDVHCVRGSEQDVLDRYHTAAVEVAAGTVVRITGDCPLVDPRLVDRMVAIQQSERDEWDLVTNRHPLTFPDGMDVDVMPFASLRLAWEQARTPAQREHVIPFFWEAGLRVKNIEHPKDLFRTYRWTIDYEEDIQLVTRLFEALHREGAVFSMDEILSYLDAHPELRDLNARYLP